MTLLIVLAVLAPLIAAGATGGVFPPGDNLVSSGLPPIPDRIATRAAPYTMFRSAAFLGWRGDRSEMLVATRLGLTAQVYLVSSPGLPPRRLTQFPDQVVTASWPRTGGEYFVFAKDRGGDEFSQLYRYDMPDGHTTLLTDGSSRCLMGAWSHTEGKLAYTSTRRNGRDADIYVIDPLHPETDRLAAALQGGGWSVEDWSPDGAKLLLSEFRSVAQSRLWLLDLDTHTLSAVTPEAKISYSRARFRPDGKGFYVLTDGDNEFVRLAYVDVASGRHTYLSSTISWDVADYDLSRDGRQIVLTTNEDGVSRIHSLSLAAPVERTAPPAPQPVAAPPGVISTIAIRPNGAQVAFSLSSARSTNDAYSMDLHTLKLSRWTHSHADGPDPATFSEPELVRWKSFDGLAISGLLYRPAARFAGKRPLIINIHGGPEGQSRPQFLGQINYYMNELGVAVLFPNVRGSTGYGKTFVGLDNGVRRADSYKDIGALLDWIPTRTDLDPARVMITGGSYGGHMTLVAATLYPGRIRCALEIVGMSNLVTFLERTEKYRRELRREEYGDERNPAVRAVLESIAPLNHVDKITKPLFVIQGRNDPRVPYTEAEQIVKAVGKRGTPVWYLLANDEGHGFVKKNNSDFLFCASILFVETYLLN